MPEDLREQIFNQGKEVLNRNFKSWSGNVENRQIENHFWQVELALTFYTALIMSKERPEVKQFLNYAYELYIARSPVLGGKDGGWANGIPYMGANRVTLGDMAFMLKKLCNIDVFEKSFFKNMADYFIYYRRVFCI